MDFHAQVMNVSTTREAENAEYSNRREAYLHGHRDARHAAAEIAQQADAKVEKLRAALELARDEIAGLPHSLGYAFTHLPAIDAALAA